jgi:hypothetical protein
MKVSKWSENEVKDLVNINEYKKSKIIRIRVEGLKSEIREVGLILLFY